MFLNDGTGIFTDVSLSAGVADTRDARGLLTGDIDNDGDLDIIVLNYNGEPVVYKNTTPAQNWLQIERVGTSGSRDGFGAAVEGTGSVFTQVKEHHNSCGPGLSCDPRIIFGLGTDTDADVTVYWPSGVISSVTNAAPGYLQITE
jgi:hypothetical protein